MDTPPENNVAPPDNTPPMGGFSPTLARLEDLYGYFPRVTTTPTWTPRRLQDSFALDTSVAKLYYYDFANNAWKTLVDTSPTDAYIRALLSATAPVSYDNTTGIISLGPISQLKKTFTAGENLVAGNALSIGPYQSDGGVTFDTKNVNHQSAIAGSATIAFTVGNNSNRLLVVYANTNGGTITGITYNGVAMTSAFTAINWTATQKLYCFYLLAPATGNNNVVISGLNGTEDFGYAIYSYYNASGVGSITSANPTAVASFSQAITETQNGSLILCGAVQGSTQAISQSNWSANAGNVTVSASITLAVGDTFLSPSIATLAIAGSVSAGTPDWGIGLLEIKPATAVTYKLFKSDTASTGWNVNWKSTAFLGFSQGSYSANATATVLIAGVDTNQSGLSISSQYYIGSAGALSLTGTRKVGIATAATDILITNIF